MTTEHVNTRKQPPEPIRSEDKLFQEVIELNKDKRDLEFHLDSLRLENEQLKAVSVPKNELVELDEWKLSGVIKNTSLLDYSRTKSHPRKWNLSKQQSIAMAKEIFGRFGVPRKPSKQQLMDLIAKFEGRDDIHDEILADAILRLIGGDK